MDNNAFAYNVAEDTDSNERRYMLTPREASSLRAYLSGCRSQAGHCLRCLIEDSENLALPQIQVCSSFEKTPWKRNFESENKL